MNAGGMGKSVASDDGFVRLNGDSGDFAQHLACGEELFGNDSGFKRILIVTDFYCHDDFFKSGVSGTLSDSVDGAFHLTRSTHNSGKRVRDSYTQIVMTVRGDDSFANDLHVLAD